MASSLVGVGSSHVHNSLFCRGNWVRKRVRERGSEREGATEGEQSTHSCALLLALSLSFLSFWYRSVSRAKVNWKLESNHQNLVLLRAWSKCLWHWWQSCVFLAKKLNGNGACGWSSWSRSMTQHFVVMHKRHVHVQLWQRAKQRNGKRIRHRETLATETRPTCQCQLIVKGNASSREEGGVGKREGHVSGGEGSRC